MKARSLLQPEGFLRFREEIKLWFSASACEGVVQALAVVRMNEIPCVCAEWMDGGTLRALLPDRNVRSFYATMDRVIGTLEWIHSNYRILHRDLKPENILLSAEQLAFVSDWGIGKIQHSEQLVTQIGDRMHARPSDQKLTQTGEFIGTVIYSAPEQILGSRAIDFRADVYSLGCLMYEWETGQPPFLGRSVEEIAYQHLERPAPELRGLFKRTAFGAEAVVAKCLAKRPEDRYESYNEMRNALERCAHARDVAISPFKPKTRFRIPLVGADEVRHEGFQGAVVGRRVEARPQEDGVRVDRYAVVPFSEIEPYLHEAAVLSGIGEWKRAAEVYSRVFVPEMCRSLPDEPFHQQIAVNYGNCLSKLGLPAEALRVLDCILEAKSRPAEYFVNRSLVLLQLGRDKEAEECAKEGLRVFPDDRDLLGNMTNALTSKGDYQHALAFAQRRLAMRHDIHAVEELAGIYMGHANTLLETNWPEATSQLQKAIELYTKAKRLNPRYLVARFNLALAWFRLGEYVSASKELAEIAELPLGKEWGELWAIRRAECLNRVGAFKECVDFCAKWLGECPDSIGLQRVRAETIVDGYCIGHERDGVRVVEKSALDFFTMVVANDVHRLASDFEYLARLKAWMGDLSSAFKLLDKAEQLDARRWEVPFNRAAFLVWHLQDPKSAMHHAQRACVLGSWNPQPWRLMSTIQRGCGLMKDAEESKRRAELLSERRADLARARGAS